MIPVLWKNGVKQRLTDGGRSARARSLCVSGGDTYVAGYVSGGGSGSVPTLWINGEAVDLRPSGFTGMARSVFVVQKEK
jgi:pimeloyl-CoA synthetase